MKLFKPLTILAIFATSCSSPTVPNPEAARTSSANAQAESSVSAQSGTSVQAESSSSFREISGSSAGIFSGELLAAISESGTYTTRDSVAAYLCKFEKLPSNYRTKAEAKELYAASGKTFSKWNFNPWETLGVMVGGDAFQNREGLLPQNAYRECDVDYFAANRGTKRLVYANSCIIYYTADHYKSFSKME